MQESNGSVFPDEGLSVAFMDMYKHPFLETVFAYTFLELFSTSYGSHSFKCALTQPERSLIEGFSWPGVFL